MSSIEKALPRGYLLESYRIEQVLGAGGFSVVYLAFHVPTRRKVVIKEYFPEGMTDRLPGGRVVPDPERLTPFKQGLVLFFNEGAALGKVRHPNVVQVSNFFRANQTAYMVSDFDEGRDLRWYIKRSNGQLGPRFLYAVFPPILGGLRELHVHEFLHLDIKPANILLRTAGGPLLLDLGAVQSVRPDSRINGLRTLTRGFAPMEQYKDGNIGPWSDLYALGATMHACIVGKPPPAAHERAEGDRYTPLMRTHHRKYPRGLLEAIDWSLELDYRKRPQDVDAFARLMLRAAPSGWAGAAMDWGAGERS